ncbi:MAG: hypothetical protein AAF702_29250 [Chloroflexota bacterium]
MPIILSVAKSEQASALWAAGPEGLYSVNPSGNGDKLTQVAQPQQELYCCGAADDRVLVGGMPHGVAFSLDNGGNWQASWMDGVSAPVLCIAADPRVEETGVLLAGAAGGGILRSRDRGAAWWVCNYGLLDYMVLTIAWAPVAPAHIWPRREIVFAGTEEGIYRSPNSGLGWRRCEGADGVFQVLAVAPDFHESGLVLAGTEENGLWRSEDGGYTFEAVPNVPNRIDALTATSDGWLLSDESGLWTSSDATTWTKVPDTQSTLILYSASDAVWGGGEFGLDVVPAAE